MDSEQLKRSIGFFSATSIGLGAMLGAGIFVFPGIAGGDAGMASSISFIIGGIIALAVSVCTAELSTAMPYSGGGYFFISRTYGKLWGTGVGICQWAGLVFACAFYLVSFGKYTFTFLEEVGLTWQYSIKLFSLGFTLFLLLLNIGGTQKVGKFQNIIVIALAVILVLIFSYGFIDYFGIRDNNFQIAELSPKGPASVFTTAALIFTSYLGFVQISNIGAEVKKPAKNLPRSLIWSVVIAMCLYVFVVIVCNMTFSVEELKKFGETATIEVPRKLLGDWAAGLTVFAAMLAALSSANASMISASRGVFALSKDSFISDRASKINKRFGTPHLALMLVAGPVMILLFGNRLEIFAEVASFLHLIIYAGICFSVLSLRRKDPSWYIPSFKVPYVYLIAGFGGICCLGLVFFMQKLSIIIGLSFMGLALLYYVFVVRSKSIKLEDPPPSVLNSSLLNPDILIPVNVDEEKKDLPFPVIKSLPKSNFLLLGLKEIPEQSDAEQAKEEFGRSAKKQLEALQDQLQDEKTRFDAKLVFSKDLKSQIKTFISDKGLNYILALKPLSDLKRLVIPVFDASQITDKLKNILYKLHANKSLSIKVLIFIDNESSDQEKQKMKQKIEKELRSIKIDINEFEVYEKDSKSPKAYTQQTSKTSDLILWSESQASESDYFTDIILEKESKKSTSPTLIILNGTKKDNS